MHEEDTMSALQARLFSREVLPFYLSLLALAATALLCDAALHVLGAVWIGRWLGIPGTLMIIGSLAYSLRKRKLMHSGNPVKLLRLHEYMAWAGSLLVLVHAGIHFNSILAWLATLAMVITVASGLTGKFLLNRARHRLEEARQRMHTQSLSGAQQSERTFWDSLTFDVIKQWRSVHFPITLAFAVLALAHIVAEFLFWSWK
jgi:hypothetical protein